MGAYTNAFVGTNTTESVSLREDGLAVRIVDQTLLPAEFQTIDLATIEDMCDAIYTLKVRGAPAIGVAAAYCYCVLANCYVAKLPGANTSDATDLAISADRIGLRAYLQEQAARLKLARPTAVNLAWALERMETVAGANAGLPTGVFAGLIEQEAHAIHQETVAASAEISRLGASLLHEGCGVLTHCNAGPLGGMGFGTGQGPLFYAHSQGMNIHVFADETRPLLQGARLTAFELVQAGIDTTLICDNMAAALMQEGRVQACMVGCDRIAANGDVANKIGTLGVAVLARHFGIPFYVLGPTSTIDLACATGQDIPIEQRHATEIKELYYAQPMAPAEVACYNPSFDITNHSLVSAIVTERGISYPPYDKSLAALFQTEHC